MLRNLLLAGLITAGMGGAAAAAHAAVTLLPSVDYPLAAKLSDAIAIGDAVTRVQLDFDSVDEPDKAPGIEKILSIEIPVTLAPGLAAPLGLTQTVFIEKGVKPGDAAIVSDIIEGTIDLNAAGLCCDLTIELFSDSDFVKGVPIGMVGGVDPGASLVRETGAWQDITRALDLDVTCRDPLTGAMSPCVKDAAGNGLLVLAASDVEVPEPGVWALMLLGLGLTGAALRASRRRSPVSGLSLS